MKNNLKLSAFMVSLVLAGCSSPQLPDNVKTDRQYLTSVTYTQPYGVDFDKVKRCIALTISNENVRLSDNSGSFVGPYSKRLYNIEHSRTDYAPNTLVHLDEFHRHIVVNGSAGYINGLVNYIIRFRLQVQTRPLTNETNMLFDNIIRAPMQTGFSANTGFKPVGTWYGAGTLDVTQAIEIVKNNLTACFNN